MGGDDLDTDGPEPLATVGQLSSPRFASFFEPPLYTREKEKILLLLRRPPRDQSRDVPVSRSPLPSAHLQRCYTSVPDPGFWIAFIRRSG